MSERASNFLTCPGSNARSARVAVAVDHLCVRRLVCGGSGLVLFRHAPRKTDGVRARGPYRQRCVRANGPGAVVRHGSSVGR